MDHIVFDIEVQRVPGENNITWDDTDKLLMSVGCVYEYQGQRMRVYGPDDVAALQERLLRADRITSYNGMKFDYPVLWGYSRAQWDSLSLINGLKTFLLSKTNDLLRRIWQDGLRFDPDVFTSETHSGWGLDAVSRATLNAPGKIGYGGDAPKWFQAGQWAKLCTYCQDDVALTRDLSDFIDRYGYVINPKTGQVLQLPKR